jgi:hypothetical protein
LLEISVCGCVVEDVGVAAPCDCDLDEVLDLGCED